MKIWKYGISITHDTNIPMPAGAELLSVLQEDGVIWLYAQVDVSKLCEDRTFRVVGTGHTFDGCYVGSARIGPFVWHVLEVT